MIFRGKQPKNTKSIVMLINETIEKYQQELNKYPNIIYVGEEDALEIFQIDITIDMAYRAVLIGIDKELSRGSMYCRKIYKKTYAREYTNTHQWLIDGYPAAVERFTKAFCELHDNWTMTPWDRVKRFLGFGRINE